MQLIPDAHKLAFGETLGFDVPTRYPSATHAMINALMAADSTITPLLFGMSRRTRLICQVLAALLVTGRKVHSDVDLKWQLQVELTAGIFCLFASLFGHIRFLERVYLFVGSVMLMGNALMTQVSD